jgi:heme O synthase-like polyprenyltransferase
MKTAAIDSSELSLPSWSRLTDADFVSLMKPRVMLLAVFTALVELVVAGSLWIMTNLNDNMMPPAELMNMHMQH